MKRHSILIGVSDYEGTSGLTKLNCPHNDVKALSEIVSDNRYVGEEPRYIEVIDPTYFEVTKHLRLFLRDVERDDVLIFYFSGHGLRNDNGDLFLCFKDSVETELELTALNVSRLRDVFESKRLKRVLVVLDCCYSGAAGAMLTRDTVSSRLNELEKSFSGGKGLYVLSSAGSTETAKEGAQNGIFTHHLVAGIKSGAADVDGKGEITVQDLAQYLLQRVPEDAPGQTPHLSSSAATGSFVVAFNEDRRRALDAEQHNKLRQSTFNNAKSRILGAFDEGDTNWLLVQSVVDWQQGNLDCSVSDPCFALLKEYGDRAIGLHELERRWLALVPKIVTPPPPPPEPPIQKPESLVQKYVQPMTGLILGAAVTAVVLLVGFVIQKYFVTENIISGEQSDYAMVASVFVVTTSFSLIFRRLSWRSRFSTVVFLCSASIPAIIGLFIVIDSASVENPLNQKDVIGIGGFSTSIIVAFLITMNKLFKDKVPR